MDAKQITEWKIIANQSPDTGQIAGALIDAVREIERQAAETKELRHLVVRCYEDATLGWDVVEKALREAADASETTEDTEEGNDG